VLEVHLNCRLGWCRVAQPIGLVEGASTGTLVLYIGLGQRKG
jgi:hypothetical protein